jgi:hypothetical protein
MALAITKDNGVELFLSAAQLHGDNSGEPQHQIGDLEGIARAAWCLMSNEQRLRLVDNKDLLEQFELDGDLDALDGLRQSLR